MSDGTYNYENAEVLLKVEHLSQHFGSLKAVNDVSFEIHKGEVFGLVGESGCGKTTTGRAIIRLYDVTGGNVYFKGRRIAAGPLTYTNAIKEGRAAFEKLQKEIAADAKEHPENIEQNRARMEEARKNLTALIEEQRQNIKAARYDHTHCDRDYAKENAAVIEEKYKKLLSETSDPEEIKRLKTERKEALRRNKKVRLTTQIQMVFQDPIASIDPRMTVREIISEGMVIQGEKDQKVIDEKVYELLERVGLVREHAGRYPHEFSGGQKQRIGVARAVVMNPELIIADEPVSALDVSIQAQVINLLNELRHELGLTIMFIAHDLSVVKYFSDRIGVMYYGNLVELATSDELFLNPLHPYTRSLLSAIPLPDPEYEKQRTRIVYNPLAEHDYTVQQPTLREIKPGHFIRCNDAEFEKYLKEVK